MTETCSQCGKDIRPDGWVAQRKLVRYATTNGPVLLCSAECDHSWAEHQALLRQNWESGT